MVPRVGEKAAKAGLKVQYSIVLLVTVVVGCAIAAYGGPSPTGLETGVSYVLLILAYAVYVYASVQFARALSEYFHTRVRWYRLPFLTQKRLFNKWLEEIEADPNSKS